jgi:hypothetical protein
MLLTVLRGWRLFLRGGGVVSAWYCLSATSGRTRRPERFSAEIFTI